MNQTILLKQLASHWPFSLLRCSNHRRVPSLFVIACFLFPLSVRAVDPPPDGGYADENTAEGEDALFSLIPGSIGGNTGVGFQALYSNTTGPSNTAVGDSALHDNTTGDANTATGYFALHNNTSGRSNTANGDFVLVGNTTGSFNTATGAETLVSNSTGSDNVANGYVALTFNSSGNYNTAIGAGALAFCNSSENTAVGFSALNPLTTGTGNTALGKLAGAKLTTEKNNIDIGNQGVAGESSTIRIGAKSTQKNAYIAGISGVTVAGGVAVVVDSKGHLGTSTSSARYKDKIQPRDKASEAVLSLQPVTFRYKHDLDPDGIPQFGLVAEQVAKVSRDLVARDEEGKPYTVRYEAINAMLLNEFLKEHRKVEEQEATMTEIRAMLSQQQKEIAGLTATLKDQAGQIQKVSKQSEIARPAPRLVSGSD